MPKKPKLDLRWREDLPLLDLPYMLLADKGRWHYICIDLGATPQLAEITLPKGQEVPELMCMGKWSKDDDYSEIKIPFWALKPFDDFIEVNIDEINNSGLFIAEWKVEQDSDDKNSIEFRRY